MGILAAFDGFDHGILRAAGYDAQAVAGIPMAWWCEELMGRRRKPPVLGFRLAGFGRCRS